MKRNIMSKKLLTLATMLVTVFSLAMLTACNDKEEVPYLKSDDAGKTITAEGTAWSGWSTIVQSNIDLSSLRATSSADWCTVRLVSSGSDTNQLNVSATDNKELQERQATIAVQSSDSQQLLQFFIIQQAGTATITFVKGGEDQTITSEAKEWAWNMTTNIKFDDLLATSSSDWCSVQLTKTGSQPKLTVSVLKNESLAERNATVTVKSTRYDVALAFTVTQQAAQPTIKFASGQGADQTFAAPAKEWEWTLTSNIDYSDMKVTSNETWCQVKMDDSQDSSDMKSYKLTMTAAENMSDQQRQAVVTVSSEKWNVSHSYMVTQKAATFTVSKVQFGFDRNGGNRTVTITSNASWEAECEADWVTLEQTNGYLTIRVATGATADRTAKITFKEKTSVFITVNQTKYKVGDSYNENGVTGTVGYIGDEMRFIFKELDEKLQYRKQDSASKEGTSSMDDGMANTLTVLKIVKNKGTSYPAFEAVNLLNTAGASGWYLPAINELALMKAFITSSAWSSTEAYVLSAYAHNGSSTQTINKPTKLTVYAIRQF